MPIHVDHDVRRAELARAVWRIVVRDGVRAATVRGVAREAGLSMGSVRHFFGTQDELLRFAVEEVVDQARRRIEAGTAARQSAVAEGRSLEPVADLLEEVIPLDDERLIEAEVWSAFTAPPVTDPVIAAIRRQVDDGVRDICRSALSALAELGRLHPARLLDVEVARLHALVDGLTLHVMRATAGLDRDRVRAILLTHLGDVRAAPSRM
jgi:AcrR family transcriptional regulator